MGRLKYITQPFLTTYRKPSSPDVGEGVLTLPLAVRRETAVRMGGWYSQRFRKPPRKGGRGRPPLQLEWDGCEICRRAYTYRHQRYDTRWLSLYIRFPSSGPRGVGDAAPYGWVRVRRFSNHPPPSQAAARGASGTPPLTGCLLTFPDCLHPPASIRPRGVKRRKSQKGGWLHKTPGAEKTKKPKRVARGFYAF